MEKLASVFSNLLQARWLQVSLAHHHNYLGRHNYWAIILEPPGCGAIPEIKMKINKESSSSSMSKKRPSPIHRPPAICVWTPNGLCVDPPLSVCGPPIVCVWTPCCLCVDPPLSVCGPPAVCVRTPCCLCVDPLPSVCGPPAVVLNGAFVQLTSGFSYQIHSGLDVCLFQIHIGLDVCLSRNKDTLKSRGGSAAPPTYFIIIIFKNPSQRDPTESTIVYQGGYTPMGIPQGYIVKSGK